MVKCQYISTDWLKILSPKEPNYKTDLEIEAIDIDVKFMN